MQSVGKILEDTDHVHGHMHASHMHHKTQILSVIDINKMYSHKNNVGRDTVSVPVRFLPSIIERATTVVCGSFRPATIPVLFWAPVSGKNDHK